MFFIILLYRISYIRSSPFSVPTASYWYLDIYPIELPPKLSLIIKLEFAGLKVSYILKNLDYLYPTVDTTDPRFKNAKSEAFCSPVLIMVS